MSIRRRISGILFGLTVPQEYVCLTQKELDLPFSFYLTTKEHGFAIDITKTHLFLGYKPVVFAIQFENDGIEHKHLSRQDEFCISVTQDNFPVNSQWRGFQTSRNVLAKMTLQKIHTLSADTRTILLLKATYGTHSFISHAHQWMNDLRRTIKPPKNNAIPLEGNLGSQVRIAYAVPRIISVITLLAANGNMNMFPTDLHGSIGNTLYMSSLRIGGKASQQVNEVRKLVLSDVAATAYNETYALGKNHMKEPGLVSEFETDGVSRLLRIPLPRHVTSYRELQVKNTFDVGIHRIYLYDILNEVSIDGVPCLSHIHQYAAQWRTDHGLQTPRLLRS